jgi:hypothetical protein
MTLKSESLMRNTTLQIHSYLSNFGQKVEITLYITVINKYAWLINYRKVAGNIYYNLLWKLHDSLCPSIFALTWRLNQEKTLDVLASSCRFLLVSWVPTAVIKTCLDHWTCQFLKKYITAMEYCINERFLSSILVYFGTLKHTSNKIIKEYQMMSFPVSLPVR